MCFPVRFYLPSSIHRSDKKERREKKAIKILNRNKSLENKMFLINTTHVRISFSSLRSSRSLLSGFFAVLFLYFVLTYGKRFDCILNRPPHTQNRRQRDEPEKNLYHRRSLNGRKWKNECDDKKPKNIVNDKDERGYTHMRIRVFFSSRMSMKRETVRDLVSFSWFRFSALFRLFSSLLLSDWIILSLLRLFLFIYLPYLVGLMLDTSLYCSSQQLLS